MSISPSTSVMHITAQGIARALSGEVGRRLAWRPTASHRKGCAYDSQLSNGLVSPG